MLDGSKVPIYIPLTVRNVLDRVSQEDIFQHYIGHPPQVGSLILSPLRQDRSPTCSFFYTGRKLLLKDFGSSFVGDVFDTICKMYGCSLKEALSIVNNDLGLKLGRGQRKDIKVSRVLQTSKKHERKAAKQHLIQVEVNQTFSRREREWWIQFGITTDILKRFSVYSVNKLFLNKKLIAVSSVSDPIYAYYFPTGRLKIYRPLKLGFKWLSNITNEDVQGIYKVDPKTDLIITSSLKDVMTLYAAGYNAVAPQGESCSFSKDLIRLINLVPAAYILYDNDNAGKILSARQVELYPKLINIEIPEESWAKDPSDFVRDYSLTTLSNLLKNYGIRGI